MANDQRLTLPIGIQSFEKLRKGHYYYVDKTPLIDSMAKIGG
ncbi:AAA family ATPase, partial [Ectothiorhodospira shaposhnikovii]